MGGVGSVAGNAAPSRVVVLKSSACANLFSYSQILPVFPSRIDINNTLLFVHGYMC